MSTLGKSSSDRRGNESVSKTEKFHSNENPIQNLDDLIPLSAKDPELIKVKHQRIVDCSCRLFFKKGYHPTTIRDIAKACGMSMGQLYHYISSKDDVLFLVHKQMQNMWYEHLVKFGVLEIKSPINRLTMALKLTLELIAKNKKLFLFIYTESKHLERKHLHNVLKIDDEDIVGFWRGLLEELNQEKPLKDDIDFLANLITYISVFLALRGWNLKGRPTNKNIASLVNFILGGLDLI